MIVRHAGIQLRHQKTEACQHYGESTEWTTEGKFRVKNFDVISLLSTLLYGQTLELTSSWGIEWISHRIELLETLNMRSQHFFRLTSSLGGLTCRWERRRGDLKQKSLVISVRNSRRLNELTLSTKFSFLSFSFWAEKRDDHSPSSLIASFCLRIDSNSTFLVTWSI